MLINYYSCVVHFLSNWTPPAPKIIDNDGKNAISAKDEKNDPEIIVK